MDYHLCLYHSCFLEGYYFLLGNSSFLVFDKSRQGICICLGSSLVIKRVFVFCLV